MYCLTSKEGKSSPPPKALGEPEMKTVAEGRVENSDVS